MPALLAGLLASVLVTLLASGCGNAAAAPLPTWTGPAPDLAAGSSATAAEQPEPAPSASAPTPSAGTFTPTGLALPDLDVRSEVVEVGVTDDLVLEVPDDPQVVGLWSDGARPNHGTGSIVLVGHVDYRGLPGALQRLGDLSAGSQAVLSGADGQEVRYVVERVDVYRKSALPFEDVFRFDVPERLVLITCGGEFDRTSGHYDSNVVAYLARAGPGPGPAADPGGLPSGA